MERGATGEIDGVDLGSEVWSEPTADGLAKLMNLNGDWLTP